MMTSNSVGKYTHAQYWYLTLTENEIEDQLSKNKTNKKLDKRKRKPYFCELERCHRKTSANFCLSCMMKLLQKKYGNEKTKKLLAKHGLTKADL